MQDCNSSLEGQRWEFAADGTLRTQGSCLDVAWGSRDLGAVIQLNECNNNAAQQFRLTPAGDLVNPQADKCVDVADVNRNLGAVLHLWWCVGAENQKWAVR